MQLLVVPLKELDKQFGIEDGGPDGDEDHKHEQAEQPEMKEWTMGFLANVDACSVPHARMKYSGDSRSVTGLRLRPEQLCPHLAGCVLCAKNFFLPLFYCGGWCGGRAALHCSR